MGCFVCMRQRESKREMLREKGSREGERVHVAAVAQLVREERKRLEQIHPKACCPTCLNTHIHSAVCPFAYLL